MPPPLLLVWHRPNKFSTSRKGSTRPAAVARDSTCSAVCDRNQITMGWFTAVLSCLTASMPCRTHILTSAALTIRPGKMGALAPLELKSIKTCEALGAREDLKTIVHDIKPQGSYSRTHCRGVFQQDGNGLILVVSGYICSTPGRARRIS